MHRFLLTFGLGVATLAWCSSSAGADTRGAASTDESGADAIASTSVSHGQSAGTREDCTYELVPTTDDNPVYDVDGSVITVDGTGNWYEKTCGTTFVGTFYISPANPLDLLAEARSRINLPLPQPSLSPNGEQIVNLTTWMWIEPTDMADQSATAAVPGLAVTVTAVPESAFWTMGDGTIVTCTGSGTPFDPSQPSASQQSDCSHAYERSSINEPGHAFAASVVTRWRLSWTVAGAGEGGDLGTIDRTTTFLVPVAEVQTVNVNPRGAP
ncbi:MAG: hypothetical protein R2733_17340 [Acidimicrobiales bacterium]